MSTTGSSRDSVTSSDNGAYRTTPTQPNKTGSNGKKPKSKKRTFWHKVRTFFQLLTLITLLFIIGITIFVGWQLQHAPAMKDLEFNPPGITLIYSSDGVLLAKYFKQNRQEVSIDRIPKDLQNATIAFEDRRFYQHQGIDFTGIGRAIVSNFKHGDLHGEGASTITQQLARNLGVDGLTRQKSLSRKLKEWFIANQIEKNYSKQEILRMYLNLVNYGSGAYGVQVAAKIYFGKDVKDLTLPECALLAGLPNRPSLFNPYKNKALAEKQRNKVLDWMLEEKYITPEQCAEAKATPVKLASPKAPKQGSQIYHAPYFVSYVFDQLRKKFESKEDQSANREDSYLLDGNLKVYTTLNWAMQQEAEEVIKSRLKESEGLGPKEACMVVMDQKTGEIKVMVGGSDYDKSQFNIVTQGRRQPGSLFKAILYSTAIDSGVVTEDSTAYDGPTTYTIGHEKWTPKDDSRYRYRRVSLREAMAQSINVPAVRVMKEVGPENVVRYAHLMGITSPLDPVLSLALGTSAVSPLEMVNAYATIANGGNYIEPRVYTRIEDAEGKAIDDAPPMPPRHILAKETVEQVDDMLRAVVTEGTGTGADEVPESRGKTGTTQDHRDVWFVGYTPNLVCGVWAGRPVVNKHSGHVTYESMSGAAWGATICVPIWKEFMLKAETIYKDAMAKEKARAKSQSGTPPPAVSQDTASDSQSDDTETKPRIKDRHTNRKSTEKHNSDGTVTVNIDDDTGLLAPEGSPNSHKVTFAEGQQPTTMAPAYANSADHTNTDTSSPGTGNTDTTNDNTDKQNNNDGTSTPSSDTTTGNATSVIDEAAPNDTTSAAPVHTPRRRRHVEKPPRKVEYVTVKINPEDGLLATKWTPEVVEKTYVKGTEPHRYTKMYAPPPGEQQ